MDIDIYQQCPCHNEKKIKFCCGKSVVGHLSDALAKSKAGQTSSALDLLERTISKLGPKDCLVTIQTRLLLEAGEIEKANASNDLFFKNNPNHPTGYIHHAIGHMQQDDYASAINSLQDALDAVQGNSFPVSFAPSFREVGLRLLEQGYPFAGRAHLHFAQKLVPNDQLGQIILQSVRQSNSTVGKASLIPSPAEPGAEWEKKYTNVLRAIDRGQFRKGLKIANKLNAAFPNVYAIVHVIAILNTLLNRLGDAADAWRAVAKVDGISWWQQCEALGYWQVINEDNPQLNVLEHCYEVKNYDRMAEIANASGFVLMADNTDNYPPVLAQPDALGTLTARPELGEDEEITLDNVQCFAGQICFYQETQDEPAKAVYVLPECRQHAELVSKFEEVFEEVLVGDPKVAVVDKIEEVAFELNWSWKVPPSVSRAEYVKLAEQKAAQLLLETWVDLPQPLLDGLTPLQAAGEQKYQMELQTLVIKVEHSGNGDRYSPETVAQLKEKLSLPPLEKIPSEGIGLEDYNPTLIPFVDLTTMSMEMLNVLQARSLMINSFTMARPVLDEIIAREGNSPSEVLTSVLTLAAKIARRDEDALDYIARARQSAKQTGQSVGLILTFELDIRLSRNLLDNINELIRTLHLRHLDEDGVEQELIRILELHGMYDAEKIDPFRIRVNPHLDPDQRFLYGDEGDNQTAAASGELGSN